MTLSAPMCQTDLQQCRWTDRVRGEMQRVATESGCNYVTQRTVPPMVLVLMGVSGSDKSTRSASDLRRQFPQ